MKGTLLFITKLRRAWALKPRDGAGIRAKGTKYVSKNSMAFRPEFFICLVCLLVLPLVVPSVSIAQAQTQSQVVYLQLKQTYRQQLDDYRTADRQYQISVEQYRQLKTLAALEDAVQQTHVTMKLRNEVLVSYLQLLQIQLQEATGVNLDQKTRMLQALMADIENLKQFRQKLGPEADRGQVNQLASEFAELAKPLESDAYRVQTMLVIGKLQTIYDKSLIVRTEIEQEALQKQDIHKAERERASQEIKSNLLEVKLLIDEINVETARLDSDFSRSSFSGQQGELTQIYAGLAQNLSYLQELLMI